MVEWKSRKKIGGKIINELICPFLANLVWLMFAKLRHPPKVGFGLGDCASGLVFWFFSSCFSFFLSMLISGFTLCLALVFHYLVLKSAEILCGKKICSVIIKICSEHQIEKSQNLRPRDFRCKACNPTKVYELCVDQRHRFPRCGLLLYVLW